MTWFYPRRLNPPSMPTAWSCNCTGPRNGDPLCPCMMLNQKEVDRAMRDKIIADLLAQGWRPPRQRVRVKAEGVRT